MKARTVRIDDEFKAPGVLIDGKVKDSTVRIDGFTVITCDKCQSCYRVKKEQIKKEGKKISCPKCKNKFTFNLPAPKSETSLLSKIETAHVSTPERIDEPSFKSGQFRIIGELGEGGMGKVFLAKDKRLQRNVAIKVLKGNDSDSRSLFLREAQITAQLDHPNIAPLYMIKTGEENDKNISFVMKHIEGQTLSGLIKKIHTKRYPYNPIIFLKESGAG